MNRISDELLIKILMLAIFFFANCGNFPVVKENLNKLGDLKTRETDEVIEKNPELQKLDIICREIPLSKNFRFVSKSMASKGPLALYYYYFSDDDFNKSDSSFREYFTEKGWQILDGSSVNGTTAFQNREAMVIIQYGGMGGDANYGITCKKLPPSY